MQSDDEVEQVVEQAEIDPVVDAQENIGRHWLNFDLLDKNLWVLMTGIESVENVEGEVQKELNTVATVTEELASWMRYSLQPHIWDRLDTTVRQEWMWLAVRYGVIDLVKMLAEHEPSLLTQNYTVETIDKTGNLHELMYVFYKHVKENKLDNSIAFKERCQNYEALSKFFKAHGVICTTSFLDTQQKEAANPAQSVENTFFLGSVHKAMHRLCCDRGYFKHQGPVKQYIRAIKKQVAKRNLLNWVEQLNNPEYCKAKGFTPATAAGALDFFRAAFASAEQDAAEHSDPRVRLYAVYNVELEHRKFSMLDIFVVAWQALNDSTYITPTVRDNLLNAWVYAMHEVGTAYDNPEKNPVLPGTRQGCAQAMVNPTIALFDGNYPGVQIKMLTEGQISYQALALVSDYIEKNNDIAVIKKWIRESGMPEELYKNPRLALKKTLQDRYREFGEKAQEMIELAMGMIEYHGVPDRLKVILLKKTFNDFLVLTLNKMTLLERVELSNYLKKNQDKQMQVSSKMGMQALWLHNPLLVKLTQLRPGFRQQWNTYLNQEVLQLLPKHEKEKLLPIYRKYEMQAIKKILINPELGDMLKVEKLGLVTRLRKKVVDAQPKTKRMVLPRIQH